MLPVVLVGTKLDLAPEQRQVNEDQGYDMKQQIGPKCVLFRETTTFGMDVSSVELLFKDVAS